MDSLFNSEEATRMLTATGDALMVAQKIRGHEKTTAFLETLHTSGYTIAVNPNAPRGAITRQTREEPTPPADESNPLGFRS